MVPMKIAIADDELYVCQQIRECLLQYSTQKNVDMDAPDIYTDCRTLYNTDLSGKRYDVVFMDIDFSVKTTSPDFSLTAMLYGNGAPTDWHWARTCDTYWDIRILTLYM